MTACGESTNCTENPDIKRCVSSPTSPLSSPSLLVCFSEQHALQLPDPAFLRQLQTLLRALLFLQQLLDVAGGAQQDVACSLHGEDGPSQSLSGSTTQRRQHRLSINGQLHRQMEQDKLMNENVMSSSTEIDRVHRATLVDEKCNHKYTPSHNRQKINL